MSNEKNWPKYTGLLYEKISFSRNYILNQIKDNEDDTEKVVVNMLIKAHNEKLRALFSFYGIDQHDPKRYSKLVDFLAFRHVRGFQLDIKLKPKGPGRPSKISTPEYDQALYWLLNQYDCTKSEKSSFSKNHICSIIRKRKDFPEVLLVGCKLPSVRRLCQHLNSALDRRDVLTTNAMVDAIMAAQARTEAGEKLIDHAEE